MNGTRNTFAVLGWAVCAMFILSADAETWYLKGGGAHKFDSNGKDVGYDWFATGEDGNWTNAVGTVGVPAAGDAVVLPEKDPATDGKITISAMGGGGTSSCIVHRTGSVHAPPGHARNACGR